MQHGLQLASSGSSEKEAVRPEASSMRTLLDLYLNLLYILHTCDPETSNPLKLVAISPDIMQQKLGFGREQNWTQKREI